MKKGKAKRGRPRKEAGSRRVWISARVRPETLAMIDAERERSGRSRGEVLDFFITPAEANTGPRPATG